MEEGIQPVLLLSSGYHLPSAQLRRPSSCGVRIGLNGTFCAKTKWSLGPSQGSGKPESWIARLLPAAFSSKERKTKKKLIVSPPSWPLTARHKFSLRLSRNLTLGLRSRKENSKLFLRVNANKISSEVFSSKGHRVSSPLRGCGWALPGHTQGPGSLLGSARKLLLSQLCHPPRPTPRTFLFSLFFPFRVTLNCITLGEKWTPFSQDHKPHIMGNHGHQDGQA